MYRVGLLHDTISNMKVKEKQCKGKKNILPTESQVGPICIFQTGKIFSSCKIGHNSLDFKSIL